MSMVIYGNTIDYPNVEVFNQSYTYFQGSQETVTPNGNIYFPKTSTAYKEDFSQASIELKRHFIHEMGHVKQYQNGQSVILGRVFNGNYDYTLDGRSYYDYGVEQQAAISADYFGLIHGCSPKHNVGALQTPAAYQNILPSRLR